MNLKQHITASFLALTQAIPAYAEGEKDVYAVTRECATQSLRDTFPVFEINEGERGVGGFVVLKAATVSSNVTINPDNGLVEYVDVQVISTNSESDIWAAAQLNYESGYQEDEFSSSPLSEKTAHKASKIAKDLDSKMRNCMGGFQLGSLKNSSPRNFDIG